VKSFLSEKEKQMNTRKLLSAIGMVAILLLVSACGFIPTRGSGHVISETRDVSGFDAVVFSGAGDVEIIQDGSESITIQTDDDVMPYVTTEVRGGTLYVGLDFKGILSIMPTRMDVTLHVDTLSRISTSGAWKVSSEELEAENLRAMISGTGSISIGMLTASDLVADISGAGNMEIAGRVASQRVGISGTGRYRAADLQSETVEIDISGAGDAVVWATESLDVTVSGAGHVDYYGSPQVHFDQSGSGNIKNLGEK
jgi:hypothetical protein